jgi:hypothetical protein
LVDRVHQAIILFAAGGGAALNSLLVEEGVSNDARLWKRARALAALDPSGIAAKRWIDGVLARKRTLGL